MQEASNWHGIVLISILVGYFLPTVIASIRGHRQQMAIAALNILLGWTLLGWVVAFVWSLTSSQPQVVYIREHEES